MDQFSTEFYAQQRHVLRQEKMRADSARMQQEEYERLKNDISPQEEMVQVIPYMIGALLALLLFFGFGLYIVKSDTWKPAEPVLTSVAQPANTHHIKKK